MSIFCQCPQPGTSEWVKKRCCGTTTTTIHSLPSSLPACLRPGRGSRTARTGSVCPRLGSSWLAHKHNDLHWAAAAAARRGTAAAAAVTSRDPTAHRQLCGINARRLSIEWIFLPFGQLCSILGYCPCFVSGGSSSSSSSSASPPPIRGSPSGQPSCFCFVLKTCFSPIFRSVLH